MKIAMIGTGWFAHQHLELLATEPEVEIVGHVGSNLPKARENALKWGGKPYQNCEELLHDTKVDAAWICVPPDPVVHLKIEPVLISQKVPFFVEKPLAANLQTAEFLNEKIEASQLIVAVGYHWRALDTLQQVRETIAANPPRMVVGSWHGDTPGAYWWRHQATSGGQIIEQATHLFDLSRFLVGDAKVVAASANYYNRVAFPDSDVAGVSAALLNYENGATGVFSATCILEAPSNIQLQLFCEGLLITITSDKVIYNAGKQQSESSVRSNPYLTEDRAFLEAVRSNQPGHIFCTYADALKTHRLCCEATAIREAKN